MYRRQLQCAIQTCTTECKSADDTIVCGGDLQQRDWCRFSEIICEKCPPELAAAWFFLWHTVGGLTFLIRSNLASDPSPCENSMVWCLKSYDFRLPDHHETTMASRPACRHRATFCYLDCSVREASCVIDGRPLVRMARPDSGSAARSCRPIAAGMGTAIDRGSVRCHTRHGACCAPRSRLSAVLVS